MGNRFQSDKTFDIVQELVNKEKKKPQIRKKQKRLEKS
jgi:hypothetical protein